MLSKKEEEQLNKMIKNCRDPLQKCPSKIIKKLLSLLQHSVTSNQIDRQLILVNDFLDASANGYWLQDLEYVIELLDIILSTKEDCFGEAAKKLLQLARIPPLMNSPIEILDYFNDLIEYFNTLGRILFEKEDYTLTLIHSLTIIFSGMENKINSVSLPKLKEAAGESLLPEVLTEMVLLLNGDMYEQLMQLFLDFCSIKIDKKMLKQGVFGNFLIRLDPNWQINMDRKRDDPTVDSVILHYDITCSFLWWFIFVLKDEPASFLAELPPINVHALCGFRYAFQIFILQEWKKIDRNNMLSLLINMFRYFDCSDFFKSGLGDDLTQLMLAEEIPMTLSWISSMKYKKCADDYVFKTMLLLFVPLFAQMNWKILEKNRVIKGLLILLNEQNSLGFLQLQNDTIITTTLQILKTLVSLCPEEFIKHGGVEILYNHIKSYPSYDYDNHKFISSIQLLNTIIRMKTPNFVKIFKHTGIKNTLIGILNGLVDKKPTPMIQKSLKYIFCCLEIIYTEKNSPKNTLELMLEFLKQIAEQEKSEYTIEDGYIQCTLDFLWKWVCSSNENLINFIKKGGIYLLLDILIRSAYDCLVLVLGVLCDLAQEELSVPYFITWRSRGHTFFTLIIKIFRETLKRMKVGLSPEGIIQDTVNPILGEIQGEYLKNKAIDSSPAIVSAVGSRRLKIYGLNHLLKVKHKEVFEIANEKYKIYNDDLSTEDKIMLILIDNYLPLKMSQVWQELQLEVEQQDLTPVSFDLQIIAFMNQRAGEWGQYIQEAQLRILREEQIENDKKEQQLYCKLKDAQTQADLNTIVDIEYIARCTDRLFRLRRKIKQSNEIKKEKELIGDAPFHKTTVDNLNITPIYNQNIDVISMEDDMIVAPEPDLSPVSSISTIASFNEVFSHCDLESDMNISD